MWLMTRRSGSPDPGFGRDVLGRYNRCLVPNLAEHIGDVSSNGGRRAWQKSPNFRKVASRGDYTAGAVPDFPIRLKGPDPAWLQPVG